MKGLVTQLQELLGKDMIRPTVPPWRARCCSEERGVFPIYLRTGYHQLEVKSEDIPETAIRTGNGHFEFSARVHASMLRRYTIDARHMLEYEQVDTQPGLTYKGQPVEIMDRKEQVLRDEVAKLVRGLWRIKKWKNPL
ncbi:hypothetical protein POM88_040550 [Heracleum sosnowskyi]|uniref:Uncharacterized protein n=1 Tax=Heracleum sosnowskyi TaxID=360622 RepID=A0AAD8HD63_9APIA|nr:hypothetical protein POM88_040550 [Heracleum sosnowskyi]